ncbi:MAG: peptidylprolyl isomerase [Gammaproteobacteria bacterium]|jgi:FKBP-type peptidyl-prolyl cis-trans isomerase 2
MNLRITPRLILGFLLFACGATAPAIAEENPGNGEEKVVIESGRTVTIEYTLKLDDGTVADSNVGGEPLKYTQGEGQILPSLEKELEGMTEGDSRSVRVSAEDGYGDVNPEFFREVPEDSVPEDARKVGQVLYGEGPNGQPFQVRVHEVREEIIVLDLNHPLAGEALNFDVTVVSVE